MPVDMKPAAIVLVVVAGLLLVRRAWLGRKTSRDVIEAFVLFGFIGAAIGIAIGSFVRALALGVLTGLLGMIPFLLFTEPKRSRPIRVSHPERFPKLRVLIRIGAGACIFGTAIWLATGLTQGLLHTTLIWVGVIDVIAVVGIVVVIKLQLGVSRDRGR
jgi:hypothetical protein